MTVIMDIVPAAAQIGRDRQMSVMASDLIIPDDLENMEPEN